MGIIKGEKKEKEKDGEEGRRTGEQEKRGKSRLSEFAAITFKEVQAYNLLLSSSLLSLPFFTTLPLSLLLLLLPCIEGHLTHAAVRKKRSSSADRQSEAKE